MNKNKLTNKIFLLIVSIQTILMGILFIIQVLRIYYGNSGTFTREICKEYILQILPVIIIWILLIIGSAVYFNINNYTIKDTAILTQASKLENLERLCPDYSEDLEEEYTLLNSEKKNRKIAWIINIAILAICSIMGLGYLLNVKHFESTGNLMDQAIKMGIHLLPWVIISFISSVIYILYVENSSRKSIEIIKIIMKAKGRKSLNNIKRTNKTIKLIARISILVIAGVLIIDGINNGGAADVFYKAINICTECIGLG